jgi:ATP-dependent DNA ligase
MTPMLASKFDDFRHEVKYPVDVTPKLDGIRALAMWKGNKVALVTRGGNELSVPHVQESLHVILPKGSVWDGELYAHNSSFHEIVSLVKGSTRDPSERRSIHFHVFDLAHEQNLPWSERKKKLATIPTSTYVKKVPSIVAYSDKEVHELRREFEHKGFEGVMVRLPEGKYTPAVRSPHLLKSKFYEDDEFPIVGIAQGTGAHAGAIVWVCKAPNGNEFSVVPKMGVAARQRMFQEVQQNFLDYKDKPLRIRYRELTARGVPREPTALGIRPEGF